jgi:hypothetical protein
MDGYQNIYNIICFRDFFCIFGASSWTDTGIHRLSSFLVEAPCLRGETNCYASTL